MSVETWAKSGSTKLLVNFNKKLQQRLKNFLENPHLLNSIGTDYVDGSIKAYARRHTY